MLRLPHKIDSNHSNSHAHQDHDSLFPFSSSNLSARRDHQDTEEEQRSHLSTPIQSPRRVEKYDAEVNHFDKEIKPRSLFWMSSFIIAAVWLLGLTIIYILHIRTTYPSIETYTNETISDMSKATCTSNSDCSGSTPFCDTLYTKKCSTCLSSSDCTDSVKKRCDVFGTRNCYECVMDRHCSGTLVCDTGKTRTCVQCVRDNDCTTLGLTTCNTATHICS